MQVPPSQVNLLDELRQNLVLPILVSLIRNEIVLVARNNSLCEKADDNSRGTKNNTKHEPLIMCRKDIGRPRLLRYNEETSLTGYFSRDDGVLCN